MRAYGPPVDFAPLTGRIFEVERPVLPTETEPRRSCLPTSRSRTSLCCARTSGAPGRRACQTPI